MLVLDNAHKNNIGKLFSILKKHPNKAMSPELVADGILILIKYTNDTDLESIIRQLKDSVRDTTISVPFYYSAYFPTHVYENIVYMIKFFFLLYAISIISYIAATVKIAIDTHISIQLTAIIINALITGLFPAVAAVLVKEKDTLSKAS